MAWLLDVSTRLPVGEDEARAHLSPSFLEQVGLDQVNAVLEQASGATGLRLETFAPQYRAEETTAGATVGGSDRLWHLILAVDDAGLVDRLEIAAVPTSWPEIDRRLEAVAPRVSFLAAEVGRRGCRERHALAPTAAQPLGSAFKLYVLGALAHAVATGQASWDEQLAVRSEWQSLGPNPVDVAAPGTRFTLREYADHMISLSDNSATDHLIHRLGRDAVERQQERFGIRHPEANQPWLTTRELFQLRLVDYPNLVRRYLGLPGLAERRAFLEEVIAPLPLPPIDSSWTEPRDIETVEWFASPDDICRAHGGLVRQASTPGLEPVDHALSLQDGLIALDGERWPTVWFKGGSELGVLVLSYLVRTADGRTISVTAMANDPTTPIPPDRLHELITIAHGATHLATPTRAP